MAVLLGLQAFVGSLPWWYYGLRIDLGFQNELLMRVMDLIALGILAAGGIYVLRLVRPWLGSRSLRLGLLFLVVPASFLFCMIAFCFVCFAQVPASFPPLTIGTTISVILRATAPGVTLIAFVSFVAALIHMGTSRN